MPRPCHSCRVLRESPNGSRKYPNCQSNSFTNWYPSDNLRGTPRCSRRSRTRAGRPHAVSGRLMLIHICHALTALCRGLEESLSERYGRGMACMIQTRPHCVCQMGKNQSEPSASLHGMCELSFTVFVAACRQY
jgi:hypothetical protein